MGRCIEVLMKPSARRAINTCLFPFQLHHFFSSSARVRLKAEILGPHDDVAVTLETQENRAGPMIMRFLIAGGGPVRHMRDHRISRHLELRELYSGAFLLVLVDLRGKNVGNEVGLQNVSIASQVDEQDRKSTRLNSS